MAPVSSGIIGSHTVYLFL